MSITTTTQIAGPVNVIFQRQLLRNAKARCPYFVGSVPGEIQSHSGSFTAKWRLFNNLTPVETPLSELTGTESYPTRTGVQPTVTDITKAVSKYGNVIATNEEVDLINFNEQANKLAEILGINAGQSLNRLQRNELEDNSTVIYSNGASDAAVNTKISRAGIREVVNTLQRNIGMKFMPQTTGSQNVGTAPIREAYWGICHTDVEEDIRDMTGFQDVISYASQTRTAVGEFGHVAGVRFIASSEGSIDANAGTTGGTNLREDGASTGADLYSTPIFAMDAVGSLGMDHSHIKEIYEAGDSLPAVMMITKAPGSAGSADPLNELGTAGWKTWHGAKILRPEWIRTLRSGATLASALA